jgi:3-methylcrotonyl-CoA carboxylase alpha subunit
VTHDDFDWRAEASGDRIVVGEPPETLSVRDEGDGRFRVGELRAIAAVQGDVVWIAVDGYVWNVAVTAVDGRAQSAVHDQDALSPPMSATVVRIPVKAGDRVHTGDTLVVLEAMKMELPIQAPRDAIVTAVHCREGELVQPGRPLVALGSEP